MGAMVGAVDRARAALQSRDFRLLLGARVVGQFADGVFQAFLIDKLVFLSPENQSTAAGVAKAFAILVIPYSLVGPVTGVVIDRWSRRRILVLTQLVRAAVAVILIATSRGEPTFWLYALVLVVVSANRFYLSTAGAAMPVLVPDEDLLMANSVTSATGTVITFAGLVSGTQVASSIGPRGLLLVGAICWPISSLIATRIANQLRASRPAVGLATHLKGAFADLLRGARRLGATPAALGSVVSISLDQFLIGAITVLSVIVFKHEFNQGVASYGRIIAAGGVGVLAGALTVGWFEGRLSKPRIVSLSFAIAGLVTALVSAHITGLTILFVSFTLGLTYPWRKVPADTIVQEHVPDRFRGRAFAFYDMAFAMPRVIAAALAILFIPHLTKAMIVLLAGLAYLAWAPVLPWWVGRPRYLRLRFYAGGRADEVPRAVVIGGEEDPVEVVGSWTEESNGTRLRRFRLRASDGTLLEVRGETADGRWRLDRESSPQPNKASLERGQ
jgi:MFS family permease